MSLHSNKLFYFRVINTAMQGSIRRTFIVII